MNGNQGRRRLASAAVIGGALALAALTPAGARAQQRALPTRSAAAVSLLVFDDATDAPLPDVRLSIPGELDEHITNAQGRYLLTLAHPGRVVFILRRLGYEPGSLVVDVAAGDTMRVSYAMTRVPTALDTVAVTTGGTSASSQLAGFERRRLSHAGSMSFVTRDDVAQRRPVRMSDLLRRYPGVRVIRDGLSTRVASSRSERPEIAGGANDLKPCFLRIGIDGALMDPSFELNSILPETVHGVEIYPGPSTVPAEFASTRGDVDCGLIMIWTRRDR